MGDRIHRTGERPRVCFVCLGNICRSPTAEGVFRHLLEEARLTDIVVVDSAGTAAYHAGEKPDRRSRETARRRGIHLDGRARRFETRDFERFDYVIAMDAANERDLLAIAPDELARAKVHMLRDFDPEAGDGSDVPDPYYGGADGFETVLDVCIAGCQGLLLYLRTEHGL